MITATEMFTRQGTSDYLSSLIESLQDCINKGDPKKQLLNEQILFYKAAVQFLDEPALDKVFVEAH